MDFHAARRMWESNAAGNAPPVPEKPTYDSVPSSVAARARSALAPAPPPVLPPTIPINSPPSSPLPSPHRSPHPRSPHPRLPRSPPPLIPSHSSPTPSARSPPPPHRDLRSRHNPNHRPAPTPPRTSPRSPLPARPPPAPPLLPPPPPPLPHRPPPPHPKPLSPLPVASPPPSPPPLAPHSRADRLSNSRQPLPNLPRPHELAHESDNNASDYSELGDYAADTDFYVPGVNDDSLPVQSVDHTAEPSDDDSYSAYDDSDGALQESEHSQVVRQDSNFSRLSAQSWLTVDSAQDVEVSEEPAADAVRARAREEARPVARSYPSVSDHDPAALFDVDIQGDLMETISTKSLKDRSVFECCAILQAGVAAYKKKSFRRFGARRVWLSSDCGSLFWTSNKDGMYADHIKLQKVAKMKCVEREVSIDVTQGYRISLLFANPDEAGLWVRALSCLIPLQALVRAPRGVIPADKEREDYNLADDTFNNRSLRDYTSVNSHVVLCAAKGQPVALGNKLAFSKSDGSFRGLRYIPFKIVPLMLRSQEEIAVLKRLDHPNIVKYHECLRDTEHGGNYVIFEHLARGILMDSSKLVGVRPIPEKAARELIRDVLNGLEYLHSLRIAHGDIRPDNLLRSVNGSVKINPIGCITHDFTEIKNVPTLVRARLGEASPAFLAPEQCWLSEAPDAHPKSYAMDVWSVGVVLYFMLYGRVPFGGQDDTAIQESICKGKLRFPRSPETSRKVRMLLKGILGEKDPKTRIPLPELKLHPWFSDSGGTTDGGAYEGARLIVSPEEVDSAVQVAKVRGVSKKV